jgi:hypothetical protein
MEIFDLKVSGIYLNYVNRTCRKGLWNILHTYANNHEYLNSSYTNDYPTGKASKNPHHRIKFPLIS